MKDKLFIDTNILVYAYLQDNNIRKNDLAISLLENYSQNIVLSTQVINEFYNVMLKNNIDEKIIREIIVQFETTFKISLIKLETIHNCWGLKSRFSFFYWDGLIVASALENNCSILYTEDLQHNLLIDKNLKILNPFLI